MNLDFKLNYKYLDFLENGSEYIIDLNTNEIFRVTEKGLRELKPKLNKNGHLQICLYKNNKRKNYYLHRVIYESHFGKIPEGFVVDHKNRNPLDNDISNLRLATQSLNSINITKMGKGKEFDFKEDIGDYEQIHEDIYFSKTFRKFYRKVESIYRSMNIAKYKRVNSYYLQWRKNNKRYKLTVTDFVINNLVDV